MKKIKLFLIILYISLFFNYGFIGLNILDFLFKIKIPGFLKTGFYWTWLVVIIIFLFNYIVTFIFMIKDFFVKDILIIRKNMLIMKSATIPFFILNFIYFLLILFIFFAATRGIGIILLPIPIVITYFILILTSIYSILFLIFLKRNKVISNKYMFWNIIFQLIFVLDIIGVIILAKKFSKNFCMQLSSDESSKI